MSVESPSELRLIRAPRGWRRVRGLVSRIGAFALVELQKLRARLEMQDKDVVNVTANSGTYNTKGDKVVLRDDIVVTSQNGYKAVLKEAAIEMKKGNVVSETPVDITLPNGWLKSNRMEIVDSGDVVRFERGVTLYIEAEKPGASQ